MCSLLPQRHQTARSSPAPSPRSPAMRNWAELSSLALLASPWPCPGLPGDARTHSRCLDRLGAGEKGWVQQASLWPRTELRERQVHNLPLPHSLHPLLSTVTNNGFRSLAAQCLPDTVKMDVHDLLNPKSILKNGYYYPHLSDEAVEIQRGSIPCPRSLYWSEAEPGFPHRSFLTPVPLC